MALGGSVVKLLIFFLVFSVVFPVAGFALTFSSGAPSTGDIDAEALMEAGIIITDADTVNVTRDGSWYDFDLNASDYRVKWVADDFTFQVPNQYLGWLVPITIEPDPYKGVWAYLNYSATYNWTYFILDPNGGSEASCFFTVYPEYDTMGECMEKGNVTITIGRGFEQQAADLWSFAGWFFGIVLGFDTLNLPVFFVWLIRIISLIGILSAVLLAREFIPMLP